MYERHTRARAEVQRILAGLQAEKRSRAQAKERAEAAAAMLETDASSQPQPSSNDSEATLATRIAELMAKSRELDSLVKQVDQVLSRLGGE